ncbi:fibronectin type III domain-containing protein [Cohnella fermenti]|uniref:Uncharacterized protein n=1 Tax=Cohnella fermenti TaxID=2565925 RepID=A0A4S4BYD8_9BACL|nr:PA14 domain-containing protein [Cohnella fermenti]THF80274.1 hypothetical protein E6C55_10310 [Cohnella fermenti]
MNGKFTAWIARLVCLTLLLTGGIPWQAQPVSADTSVPSLDIRFQSPVIAVEEGTLPDYGEVYGDRNGYSYGWNFDHTSAVAAPVSEPVYEPSDEGSITDTVYDTTGESDTSVVASVYAPDADSSIPVLANGAWEVALPNGSYQVSVSVGSAVYESDNTLFVENTLLWDHKVLNAGERDTVQKKISVKDGKLTLRGNEESSQTYVSRITIDPVQPQTVNMDLPYIGLPAIQNKIPGDKIILEGNQSNVHQTLPFIKASGLKDTIGGYLDAQLQSLQQIQQLAEQQAKSCSGCDAQGLAAAIANSADSIVYLKSGYLNLESSVTLGSADKPVFLIVDGINSNRNLSITVYGAMVVNGSINGNTNLSLTVKAPNMSTMTGAGNLWVKGSMHLNSDSSVLADGDFAAGELIYNNGSLNVGASRLIVQNSLHINTKVWMTIENEMMVGALVSNNQTANIVVNNGDMFVRDDVQVNDQLQIDTGGVLSVGGNINSNKLPTVHTGAGSSGWTKLKITSYGLKAEYYSEADLSGERITSLDPQIDISLQSPITSAGLDDGIFSARWTGLLQARYSEHYRFTTEAKGGVKLWVNDVLLIDRWTDAGNGTNRFTGELDLEAGVPYEIRMDYANLGGQPKAALYWESDLESYNLIPQNQLKPFAAPLAATFPSSTDMTVRWSQSFNADGYEVEADGIVYPLGAVDSFVHDPLTSGTEHTYRVRANGGDIKGEWSTASSLWTLPGVPQNIRTQSTSSSVSLQWNEVQGATGYDIETYNNVIDNGNSTEYTETGLNSNLQRTYRIRAKNSSGYGEWSPIVSKATLPGLTAALSAAATDTTITLSWDAVSGATGYHLEVDGVVLDPVYQTQYVHRDLLPNTSHTYRIRSINDEGTSGWSEIVAVTTLPSIPQSLHATVGNAEIRLEWEEVSGATEYEVEVDGVVVSNGLAAAYIHAELDSNTEHTYRVRAVNGSIKGNWTDLLIRTTLSAVPVNLSAAAASNKITVTWDRVIGAAGYDIEADGKVISNGLSLSYVHEGLAPNSQHTYRVRAVTAAGNGPWSEPITQTTGLGIPANIKLLSNSDSITISWDVLDGASGYELAVDGELVEVGNVTEFTLSGLTPNTWHIFRVRAKSADLVGEWSETYRRMTGLGTPVITKVESFSTEIKLQWDEVDGASGYDIEVDGTVVDNAANKLYLHKGLVPGSSHTYRVRAKTGESYSEWSEAVVVIVKSNVPTILYATATTEAITLYWSTVSGSSSYDVEMDGKVVARVASAASEVPNYVFKGLKANTMHVFRVRTINSGGASEWSEKYTKSTIPEIVVNPGKDNKFNLLIAVPQSYGVTRRTITITYDAKSLEVLDLSGLTSVAERQAGPIEGTNMTVTRFVPGEIVIEAVNVNKTFVNTVVFLAKTNENTKVAYLVE